MTKIRQPKIFFVNDTDNICIIRRPHNKDKKPIEIKQGYSKRFSLPEEFNPEKHDILVKIWDDQTIMFSRIDKKRPLFKEQFNWKGYKSRSEMINSYKEWNKFKVGIYQVVKKEMKLKNLDEVMYSFGTYDMIMLRLGLGKEYCEISEVLGFDKSNAKILDHTKKANKLIQKLRNIVKTAKGKRILQNK